MEFIDFLADHWFLSGLWIMLLVALVLDLASKAVPKITPIQLVSMFNQGKVNLWDIRNKTEWEKSRITGSFSIDKALLKTVHEKLPKDKAAVVICAQGFESTRAVKELNLAQDKAPVFVLSRGIQAWLNAGYPTISGKNANPKNTSKNSSKSTNNKLPANPQVKS